MPVTRIGTPPSRADGTKMPLVPATCVENLISCPGVLGADRNLKRVTCGVAAETCQNLANLDAAQEHAGSRLSEVAKTTVCLTGLADFGAFSAAHSDAFGDNLPVRSAAISAFAATGTPVETGTIALCG